MMATTPIGTASWLNRLEFTHTHKLIAATRSLAALLCRPVRGLRLVAVLAWISIGIGGLDLSRARANPAPGQADVLGA
ncbi:MAG TPA: hypothetical protein VGX49_03035 [Jatrophihabitans sp.]|jgi:hypothetical protein|nr:hypothetical protein [Jatrophihabitans sp.]